MHKAIAILLIPLLMNANVAHAAAANAINTSDAAPQVQTAVAGEQLLRSNANSWKLNDGETKPAWSVPAPNTYSTATPRAPKSDRPNLFLIVGASLLAGLALAVVAGGSRNRSGSGCPGGADLCIQ